MTTIHLIDASPYLFRAFFAVPKSIVDRDGQVANAVYGFTSFLVKYLADERPAHIAVAFDRNFNGSFRNDEYPAYKAQREASPPELDAQVDPCVEITEAMGITTFIDERYEADDLIATAIDQTRRTSRAHYVIVTSDKDLTQLVDERTIVVEPGRGWRFDAAAVVEKFGVRPEQITDYLGLAGDAVDNIPGVRGIGPKTAADLLRNYGSLDGIYEQLPALRKSKATLAAKLEEHAEMARLSKRLATVSTEAPIDVTVEAMRYRGPDDARVDAALARFGFETLRERMRQ